IYPYGPFPTGGGGTVMLGLQNEREWALFCEKVLLDPSLATDERFSANFKRSENREALRQIIVDGFAALSVDEVVERLENAQIANARVNDMQGVWDHPQLKARDRWREVDSPSGKLPSLLPPGHNTAFTPRMDGVPGLGQHTGGILSELGFSAQEQARLGAAGVV
ncbi:CoA transferase, partial [Pseudomonas fluorescens]